MVCPNYRRLSCKGAGLASTPIEDCHEEVAGSGAKGPTNAPAGPQDESAELGAGDEEPVQPRAGPLPIPDSNSDLAGHPTLASIPSSVGSIHYRGSHIRVHAFCKHPRVRRHADCPLAQGAPKPVGGTEHPEVVSERRTVSKALILCPSSSTDAH